MRKYILSIVIAVFLTLSSYAQSNAGQSSYTLGGLPTTGANGSSGAAQIANAPATSAGFVTAAQLQIVSPGTIDIAVYTKSSSGNSFTQVPGERLTTTFTTTGVQTASDWSSTALPISVGQYVGYVLSGTAVVENGDTSSINCFYHVGDPGSGTQNWYVGGGSGMVATITQSSSPIALIAHTVTGNTGAGITSSPIDTRGANTLTLCYAGSAYPPLSQPPFTDSYNNTWIPAVTRNESTDVYSTLWVAFNATTGASHTITLATSGDVWAPTASFAAWSGIAGGPDQTNRSSGYGSPMTTGPITPSKQGELVVSCFGDYREPSPNTATSTLTPLDSLTVPNNSISVASAYQIQTTPTTVNNSWTDSGTGAAVVIGSFYSLANPATLTFPATLPEGFVGSSFTYVLNPMGGVRNYTITQSSGTLPSGVTLQGNTLSGTPTASGTYHATFQVVDAQSSVASTGSLTFVVASTALTLPSVTCPSGTQYQSYSGCQLSASGGTSPYTYSWSVQSDGSSASLPEGLILNNNTGAITGTDYGMGGYAVKFIATDAFGTTASNSVRFSMAGAVPPNQCQIFPSNSIFHSKIDTLPVDTSPAAPIPALFTSAPLRVFFGGQSDGTPNGLPYLTVPANQAIVPIGPNLDSGNIFQQLVSSGPLPSYATVEGTSNSGINELGGDRHISIVQSAGNGHGCQLYELWQGEYTGSDSTGWIDSSNAYWDLSTNNMRDPGTGSTDAAGLPLAPLLMTYDEAQAAAVTADDTGVPTPVTHAMRFTVHQMLRVFVWPATSAAGSGICTGGGGEDGNRQVYQDNPPTSCTVGDGASITPWSGAAGELYRLKSTTTIPSACSSSPIANVIVTTLQKYGMYLADNGITGGLIATPDSRWPDTELQACLPQFHLSDFEPVNVSSLIAHRSIPITSYEALPASLIALPFVQQLLGRYNLYGNVILQ